VRVPDRVLGDLGAQYAARKVGERELGKLFARYGRETTRAHVAELLDYAERRMRAGILTIPDGNYSFEDSFDSEELQEELRFRLRVDVREDELYLEFWGPPQVRAGRNMGWTALLATVYYAVKTVVDPGVLPNAGLYRPIHVSAPPGSIRSMGCATNERANSSSFPRKRESGTRHREEQSDEAIQRTPWGFAGLLRIRLAMTT